MQLECSETDGVATEGGLVRSLQMSNLNAGMNMDAENNDDETNESSSQSLEGSKQTSTSKLGDLRPEKDPMGAGSAVTQEAGAHFNGGFSAS